MKPVLIYCYDAYCGWCYGFSPVMKKVEKRFIEKFDVEVLSGGMMIEENKAPIEKIGPFIQDTYKRVETLTGVEFGKDFLWHVFNPQQSDWVMNSEKPAIALCIFKEIFPEQQLSFASDMQHALNYEGRDLDDDEAYRHLLEKYDIDTKTFYAKLHSEEYKQQAYYEFALCKQLQVTAFPALLMQISETKFHLLANGFTPFEVLLERIELVLNEN
jgi:putative protein-disulfide isomerase